MNSVREKLLSRLGELTAAKAEVENALQELDWIERLADGSTGTSPTRSAIASSTELPNTDRVCECISHEFKSAVQISDELGLSITEVRNALSTNRVRQRVQRKQEGGSTVYRWPKQTQSADESGKRLCSVREAIMIEFQTAKRPMTVNELVSAIDGKVRTSGELRANVGATLSNLMKKELVERVSTGVYRIRRGAEERHSAQ